ncbi:organic cation transporter protein-like isoform X1 [Saccostrea echinata]|uniref:organic cation transporter protein-like isoform X1 n=2 Tax=Saccostrea echinata TaxID=191078 RepID=UPI002A812D5D|nr:organic cation transporter protein-like isoform X1 [Saccostrea echinata]
MDLPPVAKKDDVVGKKELDGNYIYGRWGPYQAFQAAFALFHIWQTGFQLLIGVFIAYRPGFQCAASEFDNQSLTNSSMYMTYEKCHLQIYHNDSNIHDPKLMATTKCPNGYQYTLEKDSTIVTEFDLVCDRANLAELLQTLVMAGQLVGAACASSLSDRVGRKTVHLGSNLLTLILGISVAFASNYATLAVMKFVLGVLQQGMVMSGVVFTLELFPEQGRFYSEVIGSCVWSTGLIIMSAIAYLLQNYSWRYLQITLTCFSVLSLFQYWIQDESLRWLVANGKKKEVERIVRKVAKWNKLDYEDLKKNVKKKMALRNKEKEETDKTLLGEQQQLHVVEKYSIITILRNKSVLIISLLMCFTWVTNTLTYFGLTLTATSLAGNRFLNFFFMSCVEYISLILEYSMLRRFGRRTTTIFFHSLTGTSLALATLLKYFSDGDGTLILLSVLATFAGKMSVTGSFSVLFLFTPELFPTNLRNVGIGMCSTFSRIGAMISPFAGTLARAVPWAPGTIFALMCFIVTIIALYLPETRGMDLPQTLDEVKRWYAENSGLRLRKSRKKESNVYEDFAVPLAVASKDQMEI